MASFQQSKSVTFTIDGTKISSQEKYPRHDQSITSSSSSSSSSSISMTTSLSLLPTRVLSRVFSEDYGKAKKKIYDPRGKSINRWNKIFLIACLLSLFVDPLFFFLPAVKSEIMCIEIELHLEIILTVIRSLADVFYIVQIYYKFRTAYIAPSSRVFGRGELVVNPNKIAIRYFMSSFFIDFLSALPLPQVFFSILTTS